MKRFWCFTIILIGIVCSGRAQQKLTDAQRNEQIQFIRQDTLPVTIEALPSTVNTPFSEYAGFLSNDSTFYFTSMRADVEEDNDHFFETSWYCYLYKSNYSSDNHYINTEALPNTINTPNTFNTNFCFNKKQDMLIYSRCKRGDEGDLQCSLWQATLGKQGWEKPKKLPSNINEVGSSNMQPFLVDYGQYQVLYFVSNRKKGVGGYDLWYSIVKDGKYGSPINLGTTINTEGNEVTPFYDTVSQTLYFSSDEHLGIGDYDIFYSQGALSQWGEVCNMGVPYNSEYNDYYFTLNQDGVSGYLSSNRPHDDMSESDTCCNDLFHFQHIPKAHTATTANAPVVTIAEKIQSLLPITLYFENDQPDARSTADSTTTSYKTLCEQYLRVHNLYTKESGIGITDSILSTQDEMAQFMRDSVASGFEKLSTLRKLLIEAVANNENITLTISGFASPLHHSDYNKHLSRRRIVSLLNYLYQADNHILEPYLRGERDGIQLRLKAEGAIEHGFSSDNKRETVYGIQAAKDRKIVISYGE